MKRYEKHSKRQGARANHPKQTALPECHAPRADYPTRAPKADCPIRAPSAERPFFQSKQTFGGFITTRGFIVKKQNYGIAEKGFTFENYRGLFNPFSNDPHKKLFWPKKKKKDWYFDAMLLLDSIQYRCITQFPNKGLQSTFDRTIRRNRVEWYQLICLSSNLKHFFCLSIKEYRKAKWPPYLFLKKSINVVSQCFLYLNC